MIYGRGRAEELCLPLLCGAVISLPESKKTRPNVNLRIFYALHSQVIDPSPSPRLTGTGITSMEEFWFLQKISRQKKTVITGEELKMHHGKKSLNL